jgi:hypothetical protein
MTARRRIPRFRLFWLGLALAGTDHHAGAALLVVAGGLPSGVVERLRRRAHSVDDKVVDLALLLGLHPLIGIEAAVRAVAARHLTGDLAGKVGDVEALDAACRTFGIDQALPGRFDATRQRRHHSEPRDNHTPHRPVLDALALLHHLALFQNGEGTRSRRRRGP